jgi:hypothetical protein
MKPRHSPLGMSFFCPPSLYCSEEGAAIRLRVSEIARLQLRLETLGHKAWLTSLAHTNPTYRCEGEMKIVTDHKGEKRAMTDVATAMEPDKPVCMKHNELFCVAGRFFRVVYREFDADNDVGEQAFQPSHHHCCHFFSFIRLQSLNMRTLRFPVSLTLLARQW